MISAVSVAMLSGGQLRHHLSLSDGKTYREGGFAKQDLRHVRASLHVAQEMGKDLG